MSSEAETSFAGGSGRGGWRFATPLMLGSTLNPVNSSMIATALVPIGDAFGVGAGPTSLLVAALYVASAIAQPTAGRLAENFGPRRIFVCGLVLVLVGGLLGALAPTYSAVVVARVLVGVGTSAAYPTAIIFIRRHATQAETGALLGRLSIASQVTVVLGLPLGGVLVGLAGWPAIFLINLPFAIAALVAGLVWLPADGRLRRGRSFTELNCRLDGPGMLLFAASLLTLMTFLISLQGSPRWWLGAASVVAIAGLVVRELRSTAPFLDVRTLARNPALVGTYARTAATMFGTYCVMYGLPQWLQEARGLDAALAGLIVVPMTLVAVAISPSAARRNLVRGPLVIGAVAALVVSVGLALVASGGSTWIVAVLIGILGITTGLCQIGNQAALYSQADPRDLGTASGLLRTSTYLGAIASSAVIGAVFAGGAQDLSMTHLAIVLCAVSSVVVVMTIADRSLPSSLGGR